MSFACLRLVNYCTPISAMRRTFSEILRITNKYGPKKAERTIYCMLVGLPHYYLSWNEAFRATLSFVYLVPCMHVGDS